MSERALPPTPKRLRDARRRGQVPRSFVLSTAGAACGAAAGFVWVSSRLDGLLSFTVDVLSATASEPAAALFRGTAVLASVGGAPLAGALVGGLVAALSASGAGFHPSRLAPDLSRLFSPGVGMPVLERFEVLLRAALLAGGATAIGVATFPTLARAVLAASGVGLEGVWLVLFAARWPLAKFLAGSLVAGAVDLVYARFRFRQSLRMTREELQAELRQSEGNPWIKGMQRALRRQVLPGGGKRGVGVATAIVVNPTHVAVALRYRPEECEAPYLVAKGSGADAIALRREGEARGVPVFRDVPLARSLLALEVGEAVPEELFRATAAILRVAMEGEKGAFQST